MIDTKIRTLLKLVEAGSFTLAAKELNLTQPAVSHHIRGLEQEFGIKIFKQDKKRMVPTPEGAILIKYARRISAIYDNARRAIEDSRKQATHITIGITQTAAQNLMPQVLALYCSQHPHTHITIRTGTIQNLYRKMQSYELDIAVVEGVLPSSELCSVLLDTDYLCLIVAPGHRLAGRQSVRLSDLEGEPLILRPEAAGTRELFDRYLRGQSRSIEDYNVPIELDSIPMIKDLVALGMGVSIIARSACREEERQGKLVVLPMENANMVREINMVYHRDFSHMEILEDLQQIYRKIY